MNYHQREAELLAAIKSGQLERVKQLLSSGIDLNTVLHSTERQDSTTILGVAAHVGRVDVMTYLVASCKASVHYQDPSYSRSALHWACMGGHVRAVTYLIQCHADVNCKDRDNVTPLIRAVMHGRIDNVRLLIEHGADVNDFDRLHSSALHYATFHGRSDVVTLLITAGCVQNTCAIFGQGTPLANLVYHRDVKNCQLIIEAGYNLRDDTWLRDVYRDKYGFNLGRIADSEEGDDGDVGRLVAGEYRTVAPLSRNCRAVIRRHVGGVKINRQISQLPLPSQLVRYLQMED